MRKERIKIEQYPCVERPGTTLMFSKNNKCIAGFIDGNVKVGTEKFEEIKDKLIKEATQKLCA